MRQRKREDLATQNQIAREDRAETGQIARDERLETRSVAREGRANQDARDSLRYGIEVRRELEQKHGTETMGRVAEAVKRAKGNLQAAYESAPDMETAKAIKDMIDARSDAANQKSKLEVDRANINQSNASAGASGRSNRGDNADGGNKQIIANEQRKLASFEATGDTAGADTSRKVLNALMYKGDGPPLTDTQSTYQFDGGGNKTGELTSKVRSGSQPPSSTKALGMTFEQASARAKTEASDKAGLFRGDTKDFGAGGRAAWETNRALELMGGATSEQQTAQPGAQQPTSAAKAPPGMRQIGTSGGRPVYEDKNGNRFTQ